MIIPADAQNQLHDNGFVVIRDFVQPDVLNELFVDIAKVFSYQFERHGIAHSKADDIETLEQNIAALFAANFDAFLGCNRQCQQLFSLYSMFINAANQTLVKSLGLEMPTVCVKPILYINSPRISEHEFHYKTPAHQDWRSMQGSHNSIVQWLPLVNMYESLGALEILPKSHLKGMLKTEEHPWYRQIAPQQLEGQTFQDVILNKGDLLVFSAYLVHQSGDITTNRFRWSCHFRMNDVGESAFIDRNYPHPYKVFIPYDIHQEY